MRKLFIDCGACQGKATKTFLDSVENPQDFLVVQFEPWEKLSDGIFSMQQKYPGVAFMFFQKAVWIEDREIDLYLCGKGSQGSTVCKEKHSNSVDHEKPTRVEAIDFSSWLEINFSKNDYIVLKIDIEGAEYEVLNKMINDGTIDWVDELIIEFHGRKQMNCTQRHHDLYKKIETYLTNSDVKVYNDNTRTIRLFE